MPSGRYRVIGDDGRGVGWEDFRSAPGLAGWRYVSEVDTTEYGPHRATVDVAVDAAWRVVRFRVATTEHQLVLRHRDGALVGTRNGESLEIPYGPEDHLDYLTPATNLITCLRLGQTAEIAVVYVDASTLLPTREHQRYELVGPEFVHTPVGRFETVRWRYTSIGSGWTSELWVAADVVVRFDRIFRLEEYDPGASGPQPVS